MFPVIFSWGSFTLHSFGVFVALGYLSTVFISGRLAASAGYPSQKFVAACFYALLAGLAGARALFIVTQWQHFFQNPDDVLSIWQGGMVFYGGFVTGFVTAWMYFRWTQIPVWNGLDILAIALPVGQAIGRLGCLAAGCCHGSLCDLPWAIAVDSELVDLSVRGQPIHPVQIYESLLLIVLSFVLFRQWKRPHSAGVVTLTYCMGYASLRFFVEYFRGDTVRGFVGPGGPSTSQAIAVAVLLIAAGALVFRKLRRR